MSRSVNSTTRTDRIGPRGEAVLVRRSSRRRRSVTITRTDGDLVVAIPATFSARQEREWVEKMISQLERKESAGSPEAIGDEALLRMAGQLSEAYLGGEARPRSVTWSSRQNRRWGSCTPSEGTIRLSHRLRSMPEWVIRGVLMHELVHLFVPDHGPRFRALLARYPESERARGFLEGVAYAEDWPTDLEDVASTDSA